MCLFFSFFVFPQWNNGSYENGALSDKTLGANLLQAQPHTHK